ncbi:hypothetical protein BO82DRAFT_397598 [Aspergillus uvarum CBS 121591]|uniref:Uncharacterized protein n=1 Tax=Aspergillus uvarum CBS 121591 TaxID=1448315 RepID=A0A319CLM0_9EURO|nr:hypothetical protein BO82DRAFT_397598 [Aspergillus uvarum CBS 121591]PYH86425.1 hypothetical protein BO82DRAFT_397598 [Aspergillus uvarum CBS 121591]
MDSKDTVKGHACLPLNLYEEWDDEGDLAYKNILRPSAQQASPYQLTPEEIARGLTSIRELASSAWGQVKRIFQWIAVLCSAVPPSHSAQNRIIMFMEALRAMPLHKVLCLGPDSNEGKDVEPFEEMPLWPLGKNWCGSADAFRREIPRILRLQLHTTQPKGQNRSNDLRRITFPVAQLPVRDRAHHSPGSRGVPVPQLPGEYHPWRPELCPIQNDSNRM